MTELGNYLIGKTIGEGTFGKVCHATHQILGHEVAVKILEKRRIHDELDVERVKREITILQMLHHPNVVQLYEMIETETHIYLFMEYADGGELFDYIDQKKRYNLHLYRINEVEACKFLHEIISAIQYIHQLRIVHRDLKPENLLLTSSKDILVVDFGLSNMYEDTLKTACGSPCYAAPEMIQGKPYNGLQTDLWSCGVILYAMLCGYLPFEDSNTQVLYKKILTADFHIPRYVSLDGKDLIKNILMVDPTKRYTIEQIKAHKWWQLWKSDVLNQIQQLPQMSPFKTQFNRVKCTLISNSIYSTCIKRNIERNISEDVKTCCDTAQQSIEYQQHEKDDFQQETIIEEEQQIQAELTQQFNQQPLELDEAYEYQQSVRSLTRQKSSQSIQSIKHLHTQIDSPTKPIVVYPIKSTNQSSKITNKIIPKRPLVQQQPTATKRPTVKVGPSKSLHEPPSFDNKIIKQPNTPSQQTQKQQTAHQQTTHQQTTHQQTTHISNNLKTDIPKKTTNPPFKLAVIQEQITENKEKSHSLKTQPTQSKQQQTQQQSAKMQSTFKTPNKQPITSFSTTKRSLHQKQAASVQIDRQSFHTQAVAEDSQPENTKIMVEKFTSRLNNIKIGVTQKSNQKQIMPDMKGMETFQGPYNMQFITNRHPQLFLKGLQKYIADKYQININQFQVLI